MLNQTQETRTLRPLRKRGSANTLRLHHLMEAQQRLEIGQRIKDLRNASPQTNRSIADYVGVGERAVANWIAGGGITWDNAKAVADLFGVEPQWLWAGKEAGPTPDLGERFAALEAEIHAMRKDLAALYASAAEQAVSQAQPPAQATPAPARRRRKAAGS